MIILCFYFCVPRYIKSMVWAFNLCILVYYNAMEAKKYVLFYLFIIIVIVLKACQGPPDPLHMQHSTVHNKYRTLFSPATLFWKVCIDLEQPPPE